MDNPENWFCCSVCEKRTRFCYLKAQLCRACAAFYRRTVTETLKYVCLFEEKCKFINSRKYCRACRYNKCRRMGAVLSEKAKMKELPDRLEEEAKTVVPQFPCKHSKLSDLINGYDSFLSAQRLLALCLNPGIENGELIKAESRATIIKTEKNSLPMMLQMFHDYYLPFNGLDVQKQIEIAARVGFEFFCYHKAFLTQQKFPDHDDWRVAITNVHYTMFRKEGIEKFMDGVLLPNKKDELVQSMKPLLIKRSLNMREFKRLQLTKRDTVCMIFMAVFKYLEYCNLANEQMKRYRNDLFEEWFSDLKAEVGPETATKRFTNIMDYFVASDKLYDSFKNTLTVLGMTAFYNGTEQLYDFHACMKYLNSCKKVF